MKNRLLITAILISFSIIATNCSYYNSYFKKESTYFTIDEIKILKESTAAIFYNYGFDVDTELDYVYSEVPNRDEGKKKISEMTSVLKLHNKNLITTFYKKIFLLEAKMINKLNEYKIEKEWKKHTYLNKYLIPPMKVYRDVLKKSLLKIYPNFKDSSTVQKEKQPKQK